MKALKIINEIKNVSIIRTLFFNYMCPNIKRKKGFLVVYKKAQLFFEKNSRLVIKDGILYFGRSYGCKKDSILRMQENSLFSISGKNCIEYGADILIKKNGQVILGRDNYFNCGLFLRCHEKITVEENCYFGPKVELHDCDGHMINGVLNKAPIKIESKVWLCSNVEVLNGVNIGEGAVIGARALVMSDVDGSCLAVGIPAKVVKTGIEWTA